MKTRELFEQLNGNYEDVMSRLMKEERVVKYLRKFTDGTEMADINSALQAEDWEAAFRAVHTLKGVSANLGLSELTRASSVLCEELRPCVKPTNDITGMLSEVQEKYDATMEAISQLED